MEPDNYNDEYYRAIARSIVKKDPDQYLLVQYREGEEKLSILKAVSAGELLISGAYNPDAGDRLFKLGEEYKVKVVLEKINTTNYR